jgi:hypothetical protein
MNRTLPILALFLLPHLNLDADTNLNILSSATTKWHPGFRSVDEIHLKLGDGLTRLTTLSSSSSRAQSGQASSFFAVKIINKQWFPKKLGVCLIHTCSNNTK